jgi:integrase
MPKSARKVDYLYQRKGSQNWWLRLQQPGRDIGKSLGTPSRPEAEIKALPIIAQHKAALLAARPRLETTWQHKLEPGREHAAPDGGRILATDRELFYIGHNGLIMRTEPNGAPAHQLVGGPLTVHSLAVAFNEYDHPDFGPRAERPAAAKRSADDAILETYLKHANIAGRFEREARAVWALYKQVTDSKPLKDATRDDGRKLVQHFEAQELRSATIQKKIGWLTAAVNHAIGEGTLKFNPFSSIVPKRDDKQRRLPLNEADIKEAKRGLGGLDKSDQVLFRLLATTGMRLSEAFEIDGEATERGVRYIIVGKKTEQSLRRVPLPAGALPYLPKVIKGKLLDGTPAAASKRLNRFLRDCGIADPRKVLHSLRHRAQDRLRAAGCPEDMRWAILGHEEETVAAGYGEGFPVPMLKKWADKIGF